MTPWIVARQASLTVGFPQQEYWRGLPFPSPGDLPDSGIEPASSAFQADYTEPPAMPCKNDLIYNQGTEMREQGIILFDLSWDVCSRDSYFSLLHAYVCLWVTVEVPEYWFGTNKFWQVYKFADIESANHED